MKIPFKYYDPLETNNEVDVGEFLIETFPHNIFIYEQTKLSDIKWLEEKFGNSLLTITQDINGIYHIRNKDAVWDYWNDYFIFKNSNDMMFFKLTRR